MLRHLTIALALSLFLPGVSIGQATSSSDPAHKMAVIDYGNRRVSAAQLEMYVTLLDQAGRYCSDSRARLADKLFTGREELRKRYAKTYRLSRFISLFNQMMSESGIRKSQECTELIALLVITLGSS